MRTSVMQFEGEKEKPGEKHIREKPKEKELKSVRSTAAKGTCLKEGRFLKKARVGARRSRTGRKGKFWHLEMQMKAFLEKAQRECCLALEEDMVESPVESPPQEQMVPADTEGEGAVHCRQMVVAESEDEGARSQLLPPAEFLVTPVKPKVQFSLAKFWSTSPSMKELLIISFLNTFKGLVHAFRGL